jgi:hypothetical protein
LGLYESLLIINDGLMRAALYMDEQSGFAGVGFASD